ncbi:hypothetical protein JCM11641_007561 [Rhodosporidiobolus odoratus]
MSTPRVATELPPELILDILSSSSRSTLLRTSLVSRTWRGPSQATLESHLSLPTQKIARAWLKCPNRRVRTRRLSLGAGLTEQEYEQVFETVDGLEELALVADVASSKAKVDARALQSKQLTGLRCLYLNAPLLAPTTETLSLQFSLEVLSCKGLYRSFPRAILISIVAASHKSLTTLDLDCYGSNASAATSISSLQPLSGSVTSLELHGSDRQTPALLSFLSSSSSLTTLTCWEATLPLLAACPPSLKHLSIGKNYIFHSDQAYFDLLSGSGLLRQLSGIHFGGISSATLRAQIGGIELLRECEERGIDVQFGVEVSGRYGTFGWPMLGGKICL